MGRASAKDTVREMLVNAAYCGYVTGLRDQSREIRGRHEPIVPEELFDRVQEVRSWRTRVLKPGPPSDEYLLRKLLYCERCGARMHGTRGSRPAVRRYICSTRRYGDPCGEPIVKAEPLEAQLVDWLRTFQPDEELRERVLAAIREATHDADADGTRRRDLTAQLQRLQDLYVMGDITKPQYVQRRQALEQELERLGPPTDPQVRPPRCSPTSAASGRSSPRPPSGATSSPRCSSGSGSTRARSSPSDRARPSRPTSRPSKN
jgi:site-specific DNA recombinase